MMFLVTGPKGRIDCQTLVVEAQTADDAAIAGGTKLGLEVTGFMHTADFRNPRSSREYEFTRHLEDGAPQLVSLRVEPTEVLQS